MEGRDEAMEELNGGSAEGAGKGGAHQESPKKVKSRSLLTRMLLSPATLLVMFLTCFMYASFGKLDFQTLTLVFKVLAFHIGEPMPNQTQVLALQDGYLAETYRTITDDGYIIQATRIIGRGKDLKNQPILMMHGLLSASDDWLLRGPHRDLPYMLADLGHDVWLGDWRGNCFSRGHVSLSTSDSRYWNTTYYFRGIHDLPAFIDLVLNVSKYDRLVYVGYSFGTTSFMVMASMLPNYAEKIALAVLLSPIGVKLENGYHFVEHIAREIVESVPETTPSLTYEFLPRSIIASASLQSVCYVAKQFCQMMLFESLGQVEENVDEDVTRTYYKDRIPSGGSSMDIIYLAQLFVNGFRAYDYGENINKEVYGQSTPPRVEVENIKVPVAIFYSVGDHLNEEGGILKLSKQLPNVVLLKKIEYEKFGHLDFVVGKNAENVLYKHVLQTIVDFDNF